MRQSARARARDLTPLFDPRSIAIVGASDDDTKWGYALAERPGAGRRPGDRPVHLVNRRGGHGAGPCPPSAA